MFGFICCPTKSASCIITGRGPCPAPWPIMMVRRPFTARRVRQPISARTAAGTPAIDPVLSPVSVHVLRSLQPDADRRFRRAPISQVAGGAKAKLRSASSLSARTEMEEIAFAFERTAGGRCIGYLHPRSHRSDSLMLVHQD